MSDFCDPMNCSASGFPVLHKGLFKFLFIFGRAGSLLLCSGFLWLWRAASALHLGARLLVAVASLVGKPRLALVGYTSFSSCGCKGFYHVTQPGLGRVEQEEPDQLVRGCRPAGAPGHTTGAWWVFPSVKPRGLSGVPGLSPLISVH